MKWKIVGVLLFALVAIGAASAEETAGGSAPVADSSMKFLAAGIAVGLAGLGAGYAIGKVGVAAMGGIVENPKLFGNTILYVAFGEAIAIYGLLVALIIVGG